MKPQPLLLTLLAGLAVAGTTSAQQRGPLYKSPVLTNATPGHAVDVDVDLAGAQKVWLVVGDGGDSFACDWADWLEPTFLGDYGEKKLTDLKWTKATSGWGQPRVGQNADGGPLRVAGRETWGIGTHAVSVIAYDVPPGTKRFRAKGGIDEGGSRQERSSLQFFVYTQEPRIAAGGGGGGGRSGGKEPEEALAALDVADGLEAKLFAHEPMLFSPSAIDVDAQGRVYVAEIINYRGHNGKRPEGDRILRLEDSDGDGVADKSVVVHQDRAIDSPHGVCVLGNKVIVSANGSIFVLTDDNGDGVADRREVLFTGIDGRQHDHGAHQVMFGPDGRLYFNIGNEGHQIRDKDGKPIVDLAGNEVGPNRKPYQQGLVFRCELDGSGVETLGWCFRNNWEVTIDSFGTLWQSDNDDDGNKGVRINYVMEFGNYGYVDEMTGASWQSPRSNMEAEIPLRHWHLNDPGVVPNLLQTGAGSPTGIMVYEGSLLPEVFRNQIIHCDAGPNVVRAYPVKNNGAGYSAEIVNVLEGVRDRWFRPSDVVAAPDGSLIVADWYDPGVGGHGMGDLDHGRLYRVAPPGRKYAAPNLDVSTPAGATAALTSPNLEARYLAFTALKNFGAAAEPELVKLWKGDNPRFRARALWLLTRLDAAKWTAAALADASPDLRITGLRAARQAKLDVIPLVAKLAADADAQVRRECAIALRHQQSSDMPKLWAELASRHDGADRWQLEALGIGADKRWDACLEAYFARVGGVEKALATPGGRDIVWRSRGTRTPELLAAIMAAPGTTEAEQPRYFRAFDFQTGEEKTKALNGLVATFARTQRTPLMAAVIQKLPSFNWATAPDDVKSAIRSQLGSQVGSPEYFETVERFAIRDEEPVLAKLVAEKSGEATGVQALKLLVKWGDLGEVEKLVSQAGGNNAAILGALGSTGMKPAIALLVKTAGDAAKPAALRTAAVEALGRSRGGEQALLAAVKGKQLAADLAPTAAKVLGGSSDEGIRKQAGEVLPMAAATPASSLPPIAELCTKKGDPESGKGVFTTLCATCHQIGSAGLNFGPALGEIGSKLAREGLYTAILNPSEAISFGFEGWEVVTKDGTTLAGMITSETDAEITVRIVGGIDNKVKKADIASRNKMGVSLMPPLAPAMTEKQIVDLVEYLAAQKKK